MTKIEMMDSITYNSILNEMLPKSQIEAVKNDVITFYGRKHNLPYGVLNAILIKAIIYTHKNENLFNEVYLRRVAETFEKEKVFTTAQAIKHLEDDAASALKTGSRVKVNKPDWLDEYIQEVREMEG